MLAGADPELRHEVEVLLGKDADSESPTQTLIGQGTRLGPYQLEAPLGRGGMGEVFRARDTRLRRTVAIKILSQDRIADPEQRRRFLQEARAASALNHPNIVTLYDIANADGVDFIVMEYVPGTGLDKLIPQGGMPADQIAAHATKIASALAAAHAAGVIHRDVKVLDFGLAKINENEPTIRSEEIFDTEPRLTETGVIVGTVGYMSPEQVRGEEVDQRSDIFSLGCVLYKMVSGKAPFSRSTVAESLAAILRDEPPLETEPVLKQVIAKCLAKQREERFQSAAEIKAALSHPVPPPQETQPSIAVLPFVNMSGDKDNEYFGDGLAEEIINALTRIPGLKVIARTSAFVFKGRQEDARIIGQTLGVTNILEGSVRKAGNRVRVTAQLVTASDGSQRWSQRYDREMMDIFAIQDEISQSISDALEVKLRGAVALPHASRRTANPAAYEAYLEGRYHMNLMTEQGMARALECFHRAIRLDPAYALPHTELAECAYWQTMFMGVRPSDVIPAALVSANRALQLDPDSPEAHTIRGTIRAFYQHDWKGAAEDFAHSAKPGAVYASARAVWFFAPRGQFQEGLDWIRRALQNDPLNMSVRNSEVWLLGVMRAGEHAIERSRALRSLFHGFWAACYMAAVTLAVHGLYEEAAAALEEGLATSPGMPLLLGTLAWVRGRQGRLTEAEELRARLDEIASKHYISKIARAFAADGCGAIDLEYEYIKQAVEEREAIAPVFLMMRRLDLHADSRFQELMRKTNLVDLGPDTATAGRP